MQMLESGRYIDTPLKSAEERGGNRGTTMSLGNEVDIHDELAGAAVTPLHKTLGVLITLITLFDGYDTFNPA
jgi:hypothetical protein